MQYSSNQENDTQNVIVKYREINSILHLDFDKFVESVNNNLESSEYDISMAYCAANNDVNLPLNISLVGFHNIEKRLGTPPNPGITTPDNWYGYLYNQPFEIPVFKTKNAILISGGFKGKYTFKTMFCDKKIAFHQGSGGCLLLQNGDVFEGSFAYQDSSRSLPDKYFTCANETLFQKSTLNVSNKTKVKGTHYFLGNMLPHFGHFLLDGLPRLWFLRFISSEIKEKMKFFILDNVMPQWGWSLLKPFGINESNVVFANENMEIENLIVPSTSYKTHIAAHSEFQKVADVIQNYYYNETTQEKRKIYLSRCRQNMRKLDNEDELEQMFSNLGFDIIVPETLSVEEQINIAASAQILAGCTGSQMYLQLFQSKKTKTIIFAPKFFFLFDDFLCASIGQKHCKFILSDSYGNIDLQNIRKNTWYIPFDDNLKADIEQFCRDEE